MNDRVITIYTQLYKGLDSSKEGLKEALNVSSIKTVENNIREIKEIEYDITLRKYRFKNLLPSFIPYSIFFNIFKDSITNKIIKNDFLFIEKELSSISKDKMLQTEGLSNIAKKILIFHNAINNNCILKIQYKKLGNNEAEYKFIRPHTIISTGFTYYVSVTYDKLNKLNVGEYRTLAFNRIGAIEVEEYLLNETFKEEKAGNAFGIYKKDQFVTLVLDRISGDFFKREILFNNEAFEIIEEEMVGESLTVKMYYNKTIEVTKLLQQWMPHIKIQDHSNIKEIIYDEIKENYKNLFK